MVSKTLCYTPGNSYVIASSRTEATKYGKIRYNYGAYPVSKRKHSESEWLEKSNVKGEMKTAQDTQELAVSLGDPTPSEPAPEAKEGRDTTLPRDAATVDRAPVVSKKQAQWTPASIPRTVKQERAIPTRLSGRDRLANRLPRGFINDVTDPMRYFFIGFYTGSGCHSFTAPGFRIVLKACEFISLYNLLYRCGVPKPNLKFYKNGRISSKYNAGHIGYVLWSYKSRTENSSAIVDLGLPSSQSHRSDLVLLQNFLPKNCPERIEHFLIFLFGYIMANGLVDWTHGSNQQQPELWYSGVQLGATDTGLLCWFSTNLISIGFQSLRRAARDTNKGKEQHTPNSAARHILYIPSTDENNSILARGINLLEQHNIPLNGKLQMLRKYLQSDGRISENFFCPRRLSFHQYIHNVKNDRTACVIAQDFYDLNLFSVNSILFAVGFRRKKLKSIYDFDLIQFLEFIKTLEVQSTCTRAQYLLLQYYSACRTRATTGSIINWSYRQPHQRHMCSECPRSYSCQSSLRYHFLVKHNQTKDASNNDSDSTGSDGKNGPYKCQKKSCISALFRTEGALHNHNIAYHVELPVRSSLKCPFEGCRLKFRTHSQLEDHRTRDHLSTSGKILGVCEIDGCRRTFKSYVGHKNHVKAKHPDAMKTCHLCSGFKYAIEKELENHLKRYHAGVNRFPCDHPGCGRRYSYKCSLMVHKKNAHGLHV